MQSQNEWVRTALSASKNSPSIEAFERVAITDAVAEYSERAAMNPSRLAFEGAICVLQQCTDQARAASDANPEIETTVQRACLKHLINSIRSDASVRAAVKDENYDAAVQQAVRLVNNSWALPLSYIHTSEEDQHEKAWPGQSRITSTTAVLCISMTGVFHRLRTILPPNEAAVRYLATRLNASEKVREAAICNAQSSCEDARRVGRAWWDIDVSPVLTQNELHQCLCACAAAHATAVSALCTSSPDGLHSGVGSRHGGAVFPIVFTGYFAARYAIRRIPRDAQAIATRACGQEGSSDDARIPPVDFVM